MTTLAELAPLFSDLTLSVDDANAIVAALHDVAESDGKHAEEIEMIRELTEALDADLGDAPHALQKMTPAKLAIAITDPSVRRVALQVAVLLSWSDGTYSDAEKARVSAYARALDLGAALPSIEKTIGEWVEGGDLAPMFA